MASRESTQIDMNDVLDVVLDNLEDIMSAHIPERCAYHPPVCAPILSQNNNERNPVHKSSTSHNNNCNPKYAQRKQETSRYSIANNVSVFRPDVIHRVELKDHVFISKDATFQLSKYIVHEHWGRDCVLLYKYLDYIFRCQLFSNQILKMKHNQTGCLPTEYLIFHTGLQRRNDHEMLYALLAPNYISKTHKNKQKWRVMFGNIEESFLCQKQLRHKFKNILYLPQRTKFSPSALDYVFNPSFNIEVSWEERLIINQDRIFRIIGDEAYFDRARKHLRLSELIYAFDEALHATKRMLVFNPKLSVPQGFIDTKHFSFRLELLLPLCVKFPKNNAKSYTFALAISKTQEKAATYAVKSVLTLNMGYANAQENIDLR